MSDYIVAQLLCCAAFTAAAAWFLWRYHMNVSRPISTRTPQSSRRSQIEQLLAAAGAPVVLSGGVTRDNLVLAIRKAVGDGSEAPCSLLLGIEMYCAIEKFRPDERAGCAEPLVRTGPAHFEFLRQRWCCLPPPLPEGLAGRRLLAVFGAVFGAAAAKKPVLLEFQ